MGQTTFIYTIKDPVFNLVRYVGQTTQGQKRFKQHLSCFNRQLPIAKFIQKYLNLGLTPKFEIVEVCSKDNLNDRERFWIGYYKALGLNLLNLTAGGESTCGYRHTKQAKLKISEASKGNKYRLGKKAWNKNVSMNNSTKTKCSLNSKRKKVICLETGSIFNSAVEASKILKLSRAKISDVCRGVRKTTHGLTFKYFSEVT